MPSKRKESCKEALRRQLVAALLLIGMSQSAHAQVNRSEALGVRDRIYKGVTLQNQHKFQEAIDEYESALAMDPSNSLARENIVSCHIDWGNFYFRQKKYEDAENEWNVALKLNPSDRNAKRNLSILKATLARMGATNAADATNAQAGEKAPPVKAGSSSPSTTKDSKPDAPAGASAGATILPHGAQKAVEDKTPPPTAVIISPVGRGQSASTTTLQAPQTPASTPAPTASSGNGAMNIFVSSPKPEVSAPPPNTTTQTPTPPANSGMSIFVPTAKTPQASALTPPSTTSSSGSIEDKLEAIEMKVYGRSQKDSPIFQRLERLEKDTSSHVGAGSVTDRLQALFRAYGL